MCGCIQKWVYRVEFKSLLNLYVAKIVHQLTRYMTRAYCRQDISAWKYFKPRWLLDNIVSVPNKHNGICFILHIKNMKQTNHNNMTKFYRPKDLYRRVPCFLSEHIFHCNSLECIILSFMYWGYTFRANQKNAKFYFGWTTTSTNS